MLRSNIYRAAIVLGLAAACAFGQAAPAFNASGLAKLGDEVKYGSYYVVKIGNGIYQLADRGDPKAKAAGLIGVDMYVINGANKAMLIDLGNNYMDGYKQDEIPPRANAAAELVTLVNSLIGKLPLEIALTHTGPDHDGMTAAYVGKKIPIWMPKGEDLSVPKKQHNVDPSVYTTFDHATKTFDLGGGRVLKPFMVRGHSPGGALYVLAKDSMIFTGDTFGIGAGRSFRTAEQLKVFAEDSQKFVQYMKSNFSPYERYAMKIYTGHSVENPIAGFYSPNHPLLDLAYMDWRFIQDQALCSNAILKGMWLVPDSGLRQMEVTNKQNGRRVNLFIYGIGGVEIPLEAGYEAAGLPMPK